MGNRKIGTFRDKHRNEPVLLLGNGPSIDAVDFDRLRVQTLGIHRSWRKCLSPYHIIGQHQSYFDELRHGDWKPEGVIFTRGLHGAGWPNVCKLRFLGIKPYVVSFDLETGTHATFAGQLAIEVALWIGFNPIYLIGYDLGYNEAHFSDGDAPFFPDDGTRDVQRQILRVVAEKVAEYRPETRIVNLNRESAVDAFPFGDLKEIYA